MNDVLSAPATFAIAPTIGRQVWFFGAPHDGLATHDGRPNHNCRRFDKDLPMSATVVYVWPSGLVNLNVIDHGGQHYAVTKAVLRQAGEKQPETPSWCEWMPYQIGQAKQVVGPAIARTAS